MKQKFLICNFCKEGESECKQCHGKKVVVFFEKYVLSFVPVLDKEKIITNKINRVVDIILFYLSIFLGVTGILVLIIWFYTSVDFTYYYGWKFWNEDSYLVLWFYFGVISFAFAFFKRQIKIKKEDKIKKFPVVSGDNMPNNWDDINYYTRQRNVFFDMSIVMEEILEDAYLLAEKNNHRRITPAHLFYVMFKNKTIRIVFIRLNIDLGKLNSELKDILREQEQTDGSSIYLSVGLRKIFIASFIDAYQLSQKNIDVLNVLCQCGRNSFILKELFLKFSIELKDIDNVAEWIRVDRKGIHNMKVFKKMARLKPGTNMNRSYTASATPLLNTFSYDLTLAAKWGRVGICVAREAEINKIFEIMSSGKRGAILVGSPGVGKKTIIEGVARLMTEENVPLFLKDKRLLSLDVGRMVSGVSASIAEKRLLSALDEIAIAGNIVLYIDNIDSLSGIAVGDSGGLSVLQVLADALRLRDIYCLASSTVRNYNKYLEGISLLSYMEKFLIGEPLPNDAIHIVESKIGMMEYKYSNVFYTYGAIETSVKMSSRLIHDKYLPEKAIDVLGKTGARVDKLAKQEKKSMVINKDEVLKTLKDMTGVPVVAVDKQGSKALLNLEQEISKYVVGQKEAISVVSDGLRRSRVNLRDENRTISNFLFLGPTGVGKTELAKVISRVYFKNEKYLVRFDMSEYQHVDSVKKMIGSIDGLKGSLTEKISKQPYSLLLLDEFEKAHPKILDLFLQIMDDGRLTDAEGSLIDFTNVVIIATSNAGALYIRDEVRKNTDIKKIKEKLLNEKLSKIMKPELLNRFDEIVVFKPLSIEDIVDITKLMLKNIEKMLKSKGILLQSTEDGIVKLAKEGYNSDFGARSLRRVLQKRIENEVAKKILEGELMRRDTVVINSDGNVEVRRAENLQNFT